jgi:Ca-activated chloride channel homolog
MLFVLMPAVSAHADSARRLIQEGNRLFANGQHSEAINKYNEALVEKPTAIEPRFNKANSYYRLDDLAEAIDLYQDVAARSKDMPLVAKAKYNLGNCFFQRGAKQRDSDLQEALDDMKTSITYWRNVLEIDPKNQKAARNIEVARLTIKDIIDQMKKQQDQQKQQQDQQDQQEKQQDQKQDQQQGQNQQDPNRPQDPNQPQDADQKQDPNQPQDQDQSGQQQDQQAQQAAPDTTAREILDKEQRQKQQRRILQSRQGQKVEKDW